MNQTVMDWSEGLDAQSFSGLALLKAASPQGARAADIRFSRDLQRVGCDIEDFTRTAIEFGSGF